MIDLEHYARIKNNYCIGYFGNSDEHLIQLKLLRPCMERKFIGLNIFLGCKDVSYGYLQDCDKVIKLSEIRKRKREFAHIKELRFDGKSHVVYQFLEKCDLTSCPVVIEEHPVCTDLCTIVTQGSYPTKPLVKKQIDVLKRVARDKDYTVEIDGPIDNAGMVAGVESTKLYDAASRGIKTILVPTGLGERLYESMFPNNEVLRI